MRLTHMMLRREREREREREHEEVSHPPLTVLISGW